MDVPSLPRITRIRARNYRSIESLDLELGDLTVLVGRNGAGKSNTVDVLRFLRDYVMLGVEQAILSRGGINTIRTVSENPVGIGVDLESNDWLCRYDLGIRADTGEKRFEQVRIRLRGDGEWIELNTEELAELPEARLMGLGRNASLLSVDGEVSTVLLLRDYESVREDISLHVQRVTIPENAADVLVRASFYDFIPITLRPPQRVVNAAPLNEEGKNLAAVLRGVLDSPDGDTLRQSLRQLVDGADDIEVQALGGHLVAEILYGAGGDGQAEPRRFDLGLESDGTIRLVAILAALYQSPPRTLIVLEEPERNIHPGALAVLADVIREASTRSQILLTTHSPELIDCFEPEDLRVVERVDGATVVGPVDAAQQQAVRDNLFTAGEIMRIQGLQRDAEA